MRRVMSCMRIDAVRYGPTPSMTMERLENPPPENTFNRPKNWLLLRNASSEAALMPGVEMAASKRDTTSAPSTKRMRVRKVSSSNTIFTLRKNASNIGYDVIFLAFAGFPPETDRPWADFATFSVFTAFSDFSALARLEAFETRAEMNGATVLPFFSSTARADADTAHPEMLNFLDVTPPTIFTGGSRRPITPRAARIFGVISAPPGKSASRRVR